MLFLYIGERETKWLVDPTAMSARTPRNHFEIVKGLFCLVLKVKRGILPHFESYGVYVVRSVVWWGLSNSVTTPEVWIGLYSSINAKHHMASLLLFLHMFAWALWNVGNKMTIEKYLPNKPSEVLFLGISLCRSGSRCSRVKSRTVDHMHTWLKNFSPSALLLSDVGEI